MNWNDADKNELAKMINSGTAYRDIAEHFNATVKSVEQAAYRFGFSRPKAAPVDREEKNKVEYWKARAQTAERELAVVGEVQTAERIIADEIMSLAPKAYAPAPFNKAKVAPHTVGKHGSSQSAVLVFSDTHIGAVVKPEQTLGLGGYDFELFLRRLYRLERSIFSILQDHTTTKIEELVIPMIGDMLDGALIHSAECAQSNSMLAQFYSGGHAIAQFFRNLSTLAPIRVHGVVGNHCVDEKTEIFTQRGWKKGDEICLNDKCLGLKKDGITVVWQPVNSWIVQPQKDRMVSIKNRQFDFRGTEHHRFYFRPVRCSGLFESPWSHIVPLVEKYGIEIPTAGLYDGTGEGVPDNLIELCGAVLTDGSIRDEDILVYQKPEKEQWVKSAFEKSGLKFSRWSRTRKPPESICGRPWKGGPETVEVTYRLSSESGRLFLQQTGLQKGEIPSWAWNMTRSQFFRFLGALLDGDGTKRKSGHVLYGKSKEWLGKVQGLCAMHGVRGCLSSYQPNNDNPALQWRLSISEDRWVSVGGGSQISYEESTNESVWCVRTDTENFLCRRNGRSYFTGNTRWGHQHKMPSKNRNSNFDMLLYLYIQALTRDIPQITWKLDWQPFSLFSVQGFNFYCAHGDNIHGGDKTLGLPAHAMGRMISTTNQLLTRSKIETPDYFLLGHLHRPIEVPHAKGAVIVNGAFPGVDGFALTNYFNSSHPIQKFFLMHPKFGRSATYDLRLDLGDKTPHTYELPDGPFTCL